MIPLRWILIGAAAAALAVGVPIAVGRYNEGLREEGRAECREASRVAAEEQAARNRELQRAAELQYTVTTAARDRFITETIVEVRREAAPMAVCPVPERVRVRLDAAAACARGDSPGSCGAGQPVPDAGTTR